MKSSYITILGQIRDFFLYPQYRVHRGLCFRWSRQSDFKWRIIVWCFVMSSGDTFSWVMPAKSTIIFPIDFRQQKGCHLCAKLCSRISPLSIPSCPCRLLWDQISLESSPRSNLPGNSHSFHHKECSQMRKNKLITQVSFATSAFPLWSSLEPLVAGSLLSRTCKALFLLLLP